MSYTVSLRIILRLEDHRGEWRQRGCVRRNDLDIHDHLIPRWCKANTYAAGATTLNRHRSYARNDSASSASIPVLVIVSVYCSRSHPFASVHVIHCVSSHCNSCRIIPLCPVAFPPWPCILIPRLSCLENLLSPFSALEVSARYLA